jgi:hypothetical protein
MNQIPGRKRASPIAVDEKANQRVEAEQARKIFVTAQPREK